MIHQNTTYRQTLGLTLRCREHMHEPGLLFQLGFAGPVFIAVRCDMCGAPARAVLEQVRTLTVHQGLGEWTGHRAVPNDRQTGPHLQVVR